MTDRFKFRAKRLDNNKFVYGYLCFIYIDNEKHCRIYSFDDAMSYDCYTETLGQCTGLKDKNGKLIYEGDIVYSPFDNGTKKVIFWDNYLACFMAYNRYPDKRYYQGLSSKYFIELEFEVIGNIHENADFSDECEKLEELKQDDLFNRTMEKRRTAR